ncbi:MAG: NAD(+)/NADH kinase [Chloroflexota bacterium]|nr:NAD(+)/NADH kinase [Chloroflexota bacterium]
MRIGFAYNPTNPAVPEVLRRGQAWCHAHGADAWDSAADDREAITRGCEGSDLVCVLGGDGTFLRTARAIGDSSVPTLGINMGRVGFLAKVEPDGLEGALDQVVAGDFAVEDRLRIGVTLIRDSGEREEHACLNDVAVARGERVRLIQVEVEVGDSHMATYVADAVVVATPTGSTAYSFSAGGAILDPRLRNMIITPVASYLSPLHSVVVGEDRVVRLNLRQAGAGAQISLDGQWEIPMAAGETVEVRALAAPLRMVEPGGSTPFYDLLRTKASLLPY